MTDWAIEGLEDAAGVDNLYSVTSSSESKAGENDTIPPEGLCISKASVLAADSKFDEEADDGDDVYYYPICSPNSTRPRAWDDMARRSSPPELNFQSRRYRHHRRRYAKQTIYSGPSFTTVQNEK